MKTSKENTLVQVSSQWQMQVPEQMDLNSSCASSLAHGSMENTLFLVKFAKKVSQYSNFFTTLLPPLDKHQSQHSSPIVVNSEHIFS
jgi:hypothetical protein